MPTKHAVRTFIYALYTHTLRCFRPLRQLQIKQELLHLWHQPISIAAASGKLSLDSASAEQSARGAFRVPNM